MGPSGDHERMQSSVHRPVLLVGGAPRVAVDAIRHLTVAASGGTAVTVHGLLGSRGISADLLLSVDAVVAPEAQRYASRADLDKAVQAWLVHHPDGVVVLSAAINDYQFAGAELRRGERWEAVPAGAKLPSGAEELRLRLVPAPKLVAALPGWGHRGPLVLFKYEAAATVLASASALRRQHRAALIVANSLCGEVQALIDADEAVRSFSDRAALLRALAGSLVDLARRC